MRASLIKNVLVALPDGCCVPLGGFKTGFIRPLSAVLRLLRYAKQVDIITIYTNKTFIRVSDIGLFHHNHHLNHHSLLAP